MEKLSKKQQRIYDFIKNYIEKNNIPPTIREICEALGLASTSTVHAHLATLERKGYIYREPSKNRNIEIREDGFYSSKIKKIPLIDTSGGNAALFSLKAPESFISVSEELLGEGEFFAAEIKDSVMAKAGIDKNDIVIAKKQSKAENGDIVIAIAENKVMCRFFFKNRGQLSLKSGDDALSPLIFNDIMILGKITALFRTF